ncbi:MAG: molybdopterin-guanine dinucleotide biosynthesis protein B [Chloroflexota bacterium]
MGPFISIVGKSGSGKTALMEKLVAEFKRRGKRVATVKHSPQGFELDTEGKDSWKLRQAGSDCVMLVSDKELACFETLEQGVDPGHLPGLTGGGFDVILVEGYRGARLPKIEVHRAELGDDLVCSPNALLAVVGDAAGAGELPAFAPEEVGAIADLIEREVLDRAEMAVDLRVNGKRVAIKPFVQDMIAQSVLGMVSTLKGVDEGGDVCLWVWRPSGHHDAGKE